MSLQTKRVVTAVDAEGRSVVQAAAPLPAITADIMPGTQIYGVWGTELDDGAEVELPAGTCIVQNGTRHAWHDHGTTTAVLAFISLAAA